MADPLALFRGLDQLQSVNRINKKWAPFSQAGVPSDWLAPYITADLNRIKGGQQPYSATQSQLMIASEAARRAGQGPLVPAPESGFMEKAREDLMGMARVVVHPGDLLRELGRGPEALQAIPQALGAGSVKGAVSTLSGAPIWRMLPGAFTAHSLTTPGQASQLGKHPLWTFMDLLPYASRAVGAALPEARAAELGVEGERRPLVRLGKVAYEQGVEQPMRERAPNRLTPRDWWARSAVGTQARELMQVISPRDRIARNVAEQFRDRTNRQIAKFNIAPDRMESLVREAETATQSWRHSLEPNEAAALRWYEGQTAKMEQFWVKQRKLFHWNEETYARDDSKALWSHVNRYTKALDNLAAGREFTPAKGGIKGEHWADVAAREKDLADRLSALTPPTRFKPLVARGVQDAVAELAKGSTDPEQWARVSAYVATEKYPLVREATGISAKDLNTISREQAATWQQLRASGFDPVFVHHVGEQGLNEIAYPSITPERLRDPSQVRKRGAVTDTWRPDLAVALSHQGVEMIRYVHSQRAFTAMQSAGLAREDADVSAEIADSVIRELGADADPIRLKERMEELKRRDWRTFDPSTMFPAGTPGSKIREGKWLVPRRVAKELDRLRAGPGPITRALAKPTGLFRLSVLALSPAYYLHVGIGSAIALVGRTPESLLRLPDAIKMVREGRVPPELVRGLADVPAETRRLYAAQGGWLARMTKGHNLWKYTEMMNDIGRSIVYFEGCMKAMCGGLVSVEVRVVGVELANKVFQNWDTMTPFERVVVRGVMPFYGFTRYIMRYVGTYPFDHPVRAAITSNFARNELEDWRKGGLPEQMMRLLYLGHVDDHGNVKAISTTGPDPFMNIGSYFTFGGFLSRTNPAISGLAEWLGINTKEAAPDLYPDLEYDPQTGKMKATKGSTLGILTSYVPQLDAVTAMLGVNKDLAALKRRDPEAWRAQVLGQLGLRFVPRTYNLPLERGKAEVQRYDALQAALNDLIKRGDMTALDRYPQLRALVASRLGQ